MLGEESRLKVTYTKEPSPIGIRSSAGRLRTDHRSQVSLITHTSESILPSVLRWLDTGRIVSDRLLARRVEALLLIRPMRQGGIRSGRGGTNRRVLQSRR